ncbi:MULTISPECIES: HD domain-containing protein [unclassified Psychrobacter]|uniref:HD domain-containing protein n=1 Tax=unclassified Psychrobacter TaxID=196806 RepID=UPI0025B5EE3B|nr:MULTISPECIES: HD domain-containing protein [unclassified Psychrobacter]MDN3451996.1 HD domain-containing protein [Psychrobacter sp. APC 3350]MDN3501726.1 HD domain-containing protein [Psychrobacter sp. 5A.1]
MSHTSSTSFSTSLTKPETASNIDIDDVTNFLLELDALKRVNRRSYVTQTTRKENSAEHSWHLAMACWSIADLFALDVNHERLLKMALVHDLGEIDAGDTFLYAKTRNTAHVEERAGIARLQAERGNGISNLGEVWEAQETGDSKETQLLKVVDRLLPFLLNLNTNGKTWIELEVTRSQVAGAHAFIKDSFPSIHDWLSQNIDYATQQGWLIDA